LIFFYHNQDFYQVAVLILFTLKHHCTVNFPLKQTPSGPDISVTFRVDTGLMALLE